MKKILLGKNLETKKAYCDFCKDGEEKKCVESYIRKSVEVPRTEITQGFFNDSSHTSYKVEFRKKNIHICFDCIDQLSKLNK